MYGNENEHAALNRESSINTHHKATGLGRTNTPKDDAERREETMQRNTDSHISRKLSQPDPDRKKNQHIQHQSLSRSNQEGNMRKGRWGSQDKGNKVKGVVGCCYGFSSSRAAFIFAKKPAGHAASSSSLGTPRALQWLTTLAKIRPSISWVTGTAPSS